MTTGLKTTISGVKGSYVGEFGLSGKIEIPRGRGLFDSKDKWILGYVENGKWAENSMQIVILKQKLEFRVFKILKARDGALIEFGKMFNQTGLIASGYSKNG